MNELPPLTGETADLIALLGEDRQGSDLPPAIRRRARRRYEALLTTQEEINQATIADLAAFRAAKVKQGKPQSRSLRPTQLAHIGHGQSKVSPPMSARRGNKREIRRTTNC